ncbi:MAG: transketolase [Candidatus Magasanikbacteria bacterium RIFCSPLOWO2_12_FULL_47_9b]|nr:MAG: transketolase [Candidatus Magasanikbacteria bacterium RIFCSPLOWO2_12_FULL_47_9b]
MTYNQSEKNFSDLDALARLVRYYILISTTAAGSGHPSSSLSAADIMTALFFGGFFRADLNNPDAPNNDRLIFSKGHASPLFYALYAAAGKISEEELQTLRQFDSRLEGHPTLRFPYTEAATGSLGQGLSVGVGMAVNAKFLDHLSYRTYVLLGDSEMAEGSVWEALAWASFRNLDNIVAIVDVNRLGQRGETMEGHEVGIYQQRAEAFGWHVIAIDGNDMAECVAALKQAGETQGKPVLILAKTLKGKGISFIEDKEGWHGKPLSKEDLARALPELEPLDTQLVGMLPLPPEDLPKPLSHTPAQPVKFSYAKGDTVATRKAYGQALAALGAKYPIVVALDAETSNSTYAEIFKNAWPDRFFEMFIAEQHMVGTALGLARRGKMPFVSTFAAFFSRAFDQIRMAQYSLGNITFVGSHCGVSIGHDGSSQMGLEDIAMFRTLRDSVVFYPSDAVSTAWLVEEAAKLAGITYLRTTREAVPVLYDESETFPVAGSKVLRESTNDVATVVAAGITLHEALKAYDMLKKEGIAIRVIDLYSIKPIDQPTLEKAVRDTGGVITVEDHYPEGGLGEAVRTALNGRPVVSLAVNKMPRSGTPAELLHYEEIDNIAIIQTVKQLLSSR